MHSLFSYKYHLSSSLLSSYFFTFDSVRKAAAEHTSLRRLWGDDNSEDDDRRRVCVAEETTVCSKCVEYGYLEKVVLPTGPIPEADITCVPFLDAAGTSNPQYDPQQCPVYFDPFYLEDRSLSSSKYEQVGGNPAICIVNPLTSDPGDKFFMTYFGTLSSDPTDVCKSRVA